MTVRKVMGELEAERKSKLDKEAEVYEVAL
jgi:hypothetical protein